MKRGKANGKKFPKDWQLKAIDHYPIVNKGVFKLHGTDQTLTNMVMSKKLP